MMSPAMVNQCHSRPACASGAASCRSWLAASGVLTLFAAAKEVVNATSAKCGVFGVLADISPMMPAALAFFAACRRDRYLDFVRSLGNTGFRHNEHKTQIVTQAAKDVVVGSRGPNADGGSQGRADVTGGAHIFDLAHD